MSYKQLLDTVANGKPFLGGTYSVLSAPVRHLFMIATLWYLAKAREKASPPPHILEIGSWQGASALSWAQGLRDHWEGRGILTCIDAWEPFFTEKADQQMVHQAMNAALSDEVAYNIFRYNMSTVCPGIITQHIRGRSEHVLPLLNRNYFDIVFVDGDHKYSKVKEDLSLSIPLVSDGGIICGDDLNLQLTEVDADFARFHQESDIVRDSATGRKYHPGVTVAVADFFEDVSSWGGFWAMQKGKDCWQKISLAGFPLIFPDHFTDLHRLDAEQHFRDIKVF